MGSHGNQTLVEAIRVVPLPAGAPDGAVAIAVETSLGTDIVISMLNPAEITVPTVIGDVSTDGRLAVILSAEGSPVSACLTGGTHLSAPDLDLTAPRAVLSGRILGRGSDRGRSWFDIDADPSDLQLLNGQTLFAIKGDARHGYQIRGIESAAEGCRVFTKLNSNGFEARAADHWDLPVTISLPAGSDQ